MLIEAPPVGYPAIVPRRYGVEGLPGDLRETAAVEALRAAVGQLDAESSRDAAAATWHAEPVTRFFGSTYIGTIAAVGVNEDSFIVIRGQGSRRRRDRRGGRSRAARNLRVPGEHRPRGSCLRVARYPVRWRKS